ncbi:hypothetical protein [Parasitella parasitica]|uniref:PROP1-like PPR domain-containing protein n=1 Tax=Parasitella parasitica TaxID=35722 RepID=A0A0B7NF39_9FUNG|nr:hypothetical protein [Parasitella parasitica]
MLRKIAPFWPTVARSTHQMKHGKVTARFHPSFNKMRCYTAETTTHSSTTAASPLYWERYRELVESNSSIEIPAKQLEALAKSIVVKKTLRPSEAVSRIQDILKYMSTRQANPEVKENFGICCNYLIRAYVQLGDMKTAKIVFDRMAAQGDVSDLSIMEVLSGLRSLGTRSETYEFQRSLAEKGLWPDSSIVYTSIIYALSEFGDLSGCRYFFAEMKTKGLALDAHIYRAMMSAYKNANQPQQVLKCFKEMEENGFEPTSKDYGLLFSSLAKDKKHSEMLKDICEVMKSKGMEMQVFFYLSMGWDPLKALQEIKNVNSQVRVRDCNSCLAQYVKNNQFNEALEVMKWMNEHQIRMDRFSYTIMIAALAKDPGTPSKIVFDLYEDMKMHNIAPDAVSFTSLINNCCKDQDLDKALSMLSEMQAYEVKPNIITFNSILSVLSSMAGTPALNVERASLIWTQMTDLGIQPDTRTCNVYLSLVSRLIKPVSAQHFEPEERHSQTSLWEELEDSNRCVPDTVKELLKMYRAMRQHKLDTLQPDFLTYSIVINALSAAGEIRSAMQVYDDAKISRVILPLPAYNEMMAALQRCGRVSESMAIWHDMKLRGVLPDNTTYSIVLENCEQLGLVDSIENIRKQRKLDFDRLQDIEEKREKRKLERSRSSRA